ncbi:DUF418 domain-containing protein [Dermatophilus congolensis]|uniref:DUF418 domain-containing protein n=1 Tax=Dermatophilus congolensis TaxID=1863 RepID=UPI001AAE480D|nr:DUF418 domain-containing protein [Dermatophilus congolensis]MBO3129127.1 DUF418 domain-containing protein [Dermatophilus congolensis]MBO3132236.1 DUF418 domain-containing protein [Dermatophilus congolensis]MBO3133603.1 DUF418 domain-containing protein [Dermatophilus congolensis]MBO3135836.1 DUF418 domain-containing protein [Dermatophilus congolensis]MBO3138078.1 DUF418 domain-containing protein [Dermatophilus congolensis]
MPPVRHRYAFLDALRGFAVAGIIFVNIPDITRLGWDGEELPGPEAVLSVFHYFVSGRFVPIFVFLFGASMVFMRESARCRGCSSWAVLARRLVALLAIGALHQIAYPGEVLIMYAVAGLIMLPAIILIPGRLQLLGGVVATVAVFTLKGGGLASIPTLMLLGAGAVSCGWIEKLERGDKSVKVTAASALAATVAGYWWQTTQPGDPRFTLAGGATGGIMAVLYITLLSLMWQTQAKGILQALFTPLGRAAFTCYLTATMIVVPVGKIFHFSVCGDLRVAVVLGAAILIAQNIFMRFWFKRFTYGPLEYPWRAITWFGVPFRSAKNTEPLQG